jgi:hypothetical protein
MFNLGTTKLSLGRLCCTLINTNLQANNSKVKFLIGFKDKQ